MTLALLGYVDQARARMDAALSEARSLDHVYTAVWVLSQVCWVDEVAHSPHEAQRHAEESVALANEHGFSFWSGVGLLSHGRSLTAISQAQEGVSLLTKGLSVLRATGAIIHAPRALMYLAEAYAKVGQPQEGLNCLAEAARLIEATDERAYEA